jgi:outer membrane protein assembly factor BamB
MKYPVQFKSSFVIWLCLLIFPPFGLVLLWLKKGSRLIVKLLGSLAAILFVILHLYLFWGLKIELNGAISRPIFSFSSLEKHNQEIDRRHAEEQSVDASQLRVILPDVSQPVATISPVKPVTRTSPAVSHAYWTEYRGPGRNGIYEESAILTNWPSGRLAELWRRPIGGGYASVVIADGVAFTIEQRRNREVVAAYDMKTGREKWIHGWETEFKETMGGDGPRATPSWYDGRLYALGAAGELRCLDAGTGSLIWGRNILTENGAENLKWGMAASPLVVDDKVIVLPGGSDGKSVVAYDRLTGKLVWSALDDAQAYTAPQLVTLAGRRQILIVGAKRAMGVTVEEGTLLWDYPWDTNQGINAAQPIVVSENRFFISAGYSHGAALVEITAKGDVFQARTVWKNNRMKNKFSSSVLLKGFLYGLDEGILACMDASTGELKWKGGRYGHGQILLASGHLIVTTESGEVALVKATPERFEEIAHFAAVEGKTWNVPAIADGFLIVRNASEMACFRIGR